MNVEDETSAPKKGARRNRTGMDVLHDVLYWIFVLVLIAMVIVGYNYKGMLQALHDYQQPTCRMVK